MKTITPLIFLIYLLAACSPENNDLPRSANQAAFSLKEGTTLPDNPNNPYDYIGAIYTDLLERYYEATSDTSSLQYAISQGEILAPQNPEFLLLVNNEGHTALTVSKVQPYFQTEGNIISMLSSGYGGRARTIFTGITQTLTLLKESDADYQQAYDALVGIESLTAGDVEISEEERAAILTTTAILRNALYNDTKRKRRDRDWEWMIGNIAATANTALESKADALLISFATDVYVP